MVIPGRGFITVMFEGSPESDDLERFQGLPHLGALETRP
jgi:hypothetical protein